MLNSFPATSGGVKASDLSDRLPEALWLDLNQPTDSEAAAVQSILGSALPSLGDLREIEASSRLRKRGGMLFMSTPSSALRSEQRNLAPPVGFVLSPDRLVTVRFMDLPSFEAVARKFASDDVPACSIEIFSLLCEEIVDHVADGLEHLAGDLNELSSEAFHVEDARGNRPAQSNRILRGQLRQVGRFGDRLSEIRDGLQGLGRVIAYTDQYACEWADGAFKSRLESLARDIHSLLEYEEQLSNKVQFVLDALVGLIGIAQNDLFKVLTIVSIVGIPPTLVAGIYGMNFKNIPEYDWSWGYAYAWAVMILSAVLPLAWFKLRKWF